MSLRETKAEDRFDLRWTYYEEDNDRAKVWGPSFFFEKELSSKLVLKIEGIYDVISGASPTGEPPRRNTRLVTQSSTTIAAPQGTAAVSGASPRSRRSTRATFLPVPPSMAQTATVQVAEPYGKKYLPVAEFEDERIGVSSELAYRAGESVYSAQVSVSNEADYTSVAGALKYSREFNEKNTTLTTGVSYNHDQVDILNVDFSEEKDGYQFLLGVSQILDAKTVLSANLVVGFVDGYLSDPYKVALVNDTTLPDHRPGEKDEEIAYISLTRHVDTLRGSSEASYRFYRNSFGNVSHTFGFAWYQNVGQALVLRPSVRYYQQSAADFYDVQFTGDPEYYSADYRLSKLGSISYGLKVVWKPRENFSADMGYERYEMWGRDGKTSGDAYPSANVFSWGIHLSF